MTVFSMYLIFFISILNGVNLNMEIRGNYAKVSPQEP